MDLTHRFSVPAPMDEAWNAFNDLEGVMATIAACGEVITVSNVVAHLAGALGCPGFVLFRGTVAPFHYWDAVRGSQSLWYPSLEVMPDAGIAPGTRGNL